MRALAWFAAVAAGVILLLVIVLGFLPLDASVQHAIRVSAAVAFGVQVLVFAAVVGLRGAMSVVGAWGLGVLLRFVALAAYAVIAVKVMALPAAPALLSLVAFLFLTTLVEPILLRR